MIKAFSTYIQLNNVEIVKISLFKNTLSLDAANLIERVY